MLMKIITVLSVLSFIYYGLVCLFSKNMVKEFERFGLSEKQRLLTGIFQLLGGMGLLVGLQLTMIGLIASCGLALLMLMGFLTRLKIGDSFAQSLPSLIYMLLNVYLAIAYASYLQPNN